MNDRDNIAILGFGLEGKSLLKHLIKHGYSNITVCDQNVDLADKMPDGVSVRLGEDYLDNLDDFHVIFRSPGIKFLDPRIQKAIQTGSTVTSGTALFMDQCPCPIVGITGTNGKGTTSTLIFEILKKAGIDVYLGGNIGLPALDFIDELNGDSVAVLEMSSFQLQDLKKSPKYAVFLNTSSDHLDYHVDTEEYMQAKEGILTNQNSGSVAVLNKDYDYEKYYRPLVKGELREVTVKEKVKNGAYAEDGDVYYAMEGKAVRLMAAADVKLIGAHNLENVLPAIVIAKEFEVDDSVIVEVLSEFSGLPHRLEFVRELNSIRFYNDSISTNAATSMAAVDSFDEPTVLIAGGSDKGFDYDEWALKILTKSSLKTVVLVGGNADKLEKALVDAEPKLGEAEGSPTKIIKRTDFAEAVLDAYAEAEKGGVVVLSPAAASFDRFKDYKERGKVFREVVGKLK